LSIEDGFALGATDAELADDVNRATMCEACNSGLNGTSVSPPTYARIMLHLIRAASRPTQVSTGESSPADAVSAQVQPAML
jgi:hypothetical protein